MRTASLLLLAACAGAPADDAAEVVLDAPVLEHTPPDGPAERLRPLALSVTATDPDGVAAVDLRYRNAGASVADTLPLTLEGDAWVGTIAGERLVGTSIEYWFEAEDASPYRVPAVLPAEGDEAPFTLPLLAPGVALPYVEDFEAATGRDDLFVIGWAEAGDPRDWRLGGPARSGTWAAWHPAGVAVEDLPPLTADDWLIGPTLDLTGMDGAQVSWWERGTDVDRADHGLWISTGAIDPSAGAFEPVAVLPPPPEGEWGPSAVYDLAPWAGQPVTLAWRYQGTVADAWGIDDVAFGLPGGELRLLSWNADRFDPGSTGSVVAEIGNAGTRSAAGYVIEGAVDPADGRFQSEEDLPTLAPGGAFAVELGLEVDPSYPDNSLLPVVVSASNGSSSVSWPLDVLVGDPSVATVLLYPYVEGLVVATLGTGDPAAPDWSTVVVSDVLPLGLHTFLVPLDAAAAFLPPSRDLSPWWVRVEGAQAGTLSGFTIDFDGTLTSTNDLGYYPGSTPELFRLPADPVFGVVGSVTDPAALAPGDTVQWTLQLRNDGGPTVGPTRVRVRTDDPEVVVHSPPLEVSATGWPYGAVEVVDVSLSLTPDKTDSRPIPFTVRVSDDVGVYEVETTLEVPWPALEVLQVEVIDDGGDGVLDADEAAWLGIELRNVGALSTGATTACHLEDAGSAVTVDLIEPEDHYGALGPGERRTGDDFRVAVAGGAPGQAVALAVVCQDAVATYRTALSLVLGEAPWIRIPAAYDPGDDATGGDLDLTGGEYRVQDGMLEIRLESSTVFDPATAFVEAWMKSDGAPWSLYQLVAQSGAGTVRGYNGSFTALADVEVVADGPQRLLLRWPVDAMELVVPQVAIGFGASFCGGTAFWCDQWPDAWGNPWQGGINSSRFVDLTW